MIFKDVDTLAGIRVGWRCVMVFADMEHGGQR